MKKYKVNVNGTVYEVTVEAMDGAAPVAAAPAAAPAPAPPDKILLSSPYTPQPPPLRRPRPPVVRRCPPLCPARSWMCVFPTAPL